MIDDSLRSLRMRYSEFLALATGEPGTPYAYALPPEPGSKSDYGPAWRSPLEYFACDVLDTCGCGCLTDQVTYVRDAMQLLKERSDICCGRSDLHGARALDDVRSRIRDLFHGDDRAEQFMWYWLDTKGWTEHGSCIPGWLTNEGMEVLEDLNLLLADLEKEKKP